MPDQYSSDSERVEWVGIRRTCGGTSLTRELPRPFNWHLYFPSASLTICSPTARPILAKCCSNQVLSFNLFSFLPLDDLFETVRSWHASAQNPPPHLTPTEMQSPANDLQDPSRTSSSTILPHSLCAFLKHTPTLRPLHWLLPQPRVIFLQLPTLLSPSCLPSQMSPSP